MTKAAPHSNQGTLFQFSRRALFFFGALLLAPWLVVAALLLSPGEINPAPPAPRSPYDEYVHQARPGPWGELQYSRIVIEPPLEFAQADADRLDQPIWIFPGHTHETLATLWTDAGLSHAQIAALGSAPTLEETPAALVVHPSPEFILSLEPAARVKIYAVLATFPENGAYAEPFRFRADAADEWFQDSDLHPDTVAQVKRLLYRRGTSLLFSDHAVLLPRISSHRERTQLLRVLARKSTLLVKLRVRPTSDIDALAAYWGRGPRRKGLDALLDSIAHRADGITIDIVHLLPRFARSHLFSYPDPAETPVDPNHDCHWTSLNFFNSPPDERFAEIALVEKALAEEYAPAVGKPLLGDVLVFARPNGDVIHSCVFIADDIVFTKNGSSEVMPWILMNLSDVIAFYPADPPLTVHVYRRKGF